jgi:small conductance mechanosensitive channel
MFSNPIINHAIFITIVLIVAVIITKLIHKLIKKVLDQDSNDMKVDKTTFKFIQNAVNLVILTIVIVIVFYSIPVLRDLGVTLLASAGIFAAVLGFASQQAFSNIISGIFIVIFKPFRVGDNIRIQMEAGIVEDITLRHTIIKNFENRRVIIPNAIISSETILNSTIAETKVCIFFEIGISYDSNIEKAFEIIYDEAINHKNFIDNRTDKEKEDGVPPVITRVIGFGDSSVNIRANVWANNPGEGFVLRCDLNKSVKERFDREGIEIPFPYRTLVYKNQKNEENQNEPE